MRGVNRIVARGISEVSAEDAFATAVAHFEGWHGPLRNHRRRIWQALAENTDRKFDAEWAAIAIRIFVAFDRCDLADAIIGYYAEQKYRAESELDEPTREMRSVRPRGRAFKANGTH